jgi:hypothetical protein
MLFRNFIKTREIDEMLDRFMPLGLNLNNNKLDLKKLLKQLLNGKKMELKRVEVKRAVEMEIFIEYTMLLKIGEEKFKEYFGKESEYVKSIFIEVLRKIIEEDFLLEDFKESLNKRKSNVTCLENTLYTLIKQPSVYYSLVIEYVKDANKRKYLRKLLIDLGDSIVMFYLYKEFEKVIIFE